MASRWTTTETLLHGKSFEGLHTGLTVGLIATPRIDFVTCCPDESVSSVLHRNSEIYDFLPVVHVDDDGSNKIVGLFHAAKLRQAETINGQVADHSISLSEDLVIGANASILTFIRDADSNPCRMVVEGSRITGLVSLSDLQKLPVRAALFALITGFEITMMQAIRRCCGNSEAWMQYLNLTRRKYLEQEIEKSLLVDSYVDSLLFTQFADKTQIVTETLSLSISKKQLRKNLRRVQKLRDHLAHANEYAATPQAAIEVCDIVRNVMELQRKISEAECPEFISP
jgi:CBS domain-containing protein